MKCRAPTVDRRRPRAQRSDRLGPDRSAAPGEQRLSLLPSGPDEVHASPVRGTRSSTSISPSASASAGLGWEFSPAGADCRYRAPLVPRLARRANSTSSQGGVLIRQRDDPSVQSALGAWIRPIWAFSRLLMHAAHGTPAGGTDSAPGVPRGGQVIPQRNGGEGGIRTHDELPHTAFPVPRPRPLGDLSSGEQCGWRRGWDSNPRCFRTPLFESGTINHSDTSPRKRITRDAVRRPPVSGGRGFRHEARSPRAA